MSLGGMAPMPPPLPQTVLLVDNIIYYYWLIYSNNYAVVSHVKAIPPTVVSFYNTECTKTLR